MGYTEERSTNDITKTVSCKDSLLPPPQASSHHPAVEEMVGCPASPVKPTSELIPPQSNPTPHHSDEHMDLFTSLFNEHQLNDPIDTYSLHSPLTKLDQDWDYDWLLLLNDMCNVTDPVCY